MLLLVFVLFAFQRAVTKKEIEPALKFPLVLGAIAMILFSIRLSASVDADDVISFGKYDGVKVYFNDSLVTSTSKRFIGNTTNYVFVHDLKENVTEVYKLNDIKKIDFNKWNGRDYSDSAVRKNLQTIKPK